MFFCLLFNHLIELNVFKTRYHLPHKCFVIKKKNNNEKGKVIMCKYIQSNDFLL